MFFLYRASNPVVLPFKVSESFWNRFKMILLDQEMDFLKNPVEKKYFFLVEKWFWKNVSKKNWFFRIFPQRSYVPGTGKIIDYGFSTTVFKNNCYMSSLDLLPTRRAPMQNTKTYSYALTALRDHSYIT